MKIEDFIYYENGAFNSCEFCRKFGFAGNCPVKDRYNAKEDYSEEEISEGTEICKSYVITKLKALLNENSGE